MNEISLKENRAMKIKQFSKNYEKKLVFNMLKQPKRRYYRNKIGKKKDHIKEVQKTSSDWVQKQNKVSMKCISMRKQQKIEKD